MLKSRALSAQRYIHPFSRSKRTLHPFQAYVSRLGREALTFSIGTRDVVILPMVLSTKHKGKTSKLKAVFPAQTISWHSQWRAQLPGAEGEWQSSLCGMTAVVFCCRPQLLLRWQKEWLVTQNYFSDPNYTFQKYHLLKPKHFVCWLQPFEQVTTDLCWHNGPA